MNYLSHADLGGRRETRPVQPEPEGELFHASWEPVVLALTLAMGATGKWNIDTSRSVRETLPAYAGMSYYEIWLTALERLITRHGLASGDELAQGHSQLPPQPVPRKLHAAAVAATLAHGAPSQRPAPAAARFAQGDVVRTRAAAADHHTRLPAYARGQLGRIERVLGAHVFADTHAQGLGEQPQWLYTVVFDGAALWGSGAALQVSIDAWEPYLEPA